MPRDFRPVVEQYYSVVYALLLDRLGDPHEAQDVAQETFLRAFERRGSLREEGSLFAWLRTIAENCCVSHLRSKGRRQGRIRPLTEDAPSPSADPPTLAGAPEERTKVLRAVQALPENYRVPILLRHLQGRSCGEIARILGTTPGTVRVTLFRGTELLRKKLKG